MANKQPKRQQKPTTDSTESSQTPLHQPTSSAVGGFFETDLPLPKEHYTLEGFVDTQEFTNASNTE